EDDRATSKSPSGAFGPRSRSALRLLLDRAPCSISVLGTKPSVTALPRCKPARSIARAPSRGSLRPAASQTALQFSVQNIPNRSVLQSQVPAYIRLSFAFSASKSLIRFSSETLTPPYFDRQLKYVGRLIPCLRIRSLT